MGLALAVLLFFGRAAAKEVAETLFELGQLALFDHLVRAAGIGRVRLAVDVEAQRVAFLAPGRARRVFGAVRHHDLDFVIIGVNICFHFAAPYINSGVFYTV